MILFIAPNPHKVREREGFLQRVAAIDAIFTDPDKLYAEDLDKNKLAKAIIEADLIYVHSIYNANKVLWCYSHFASKIITDLHGVVPEEEEYADNLEMARVMAATEKEVFKYGKHFVAVSQAMVDHFNEKYSLKQEVSWLVLPVFMGMDNERQQKIVEDRLSVIYAGGGQRWQNVDLMVDAINKTSGTYSYTILTHSQEAFSGIHPQVREKTTIKTVSSKQITEYYQNANLGFILRNDTIVNNVACPTKLIEYLANGVVPVVLSEKIGDFLSLGYKFVGLNSLLHNNVSKKYLEEAIDNNYWVYEALISKIETAKKGLISLYEQIKKLPEQIETANLEDVIALHIDFQAQTDQLLRYEYQIEVYQQKISEYAQAVEYYRKQELVAKEHNQKHGAKHAKKGLRRRLES